MIRQHNSNKSASEFIGAIHSGKREVYLLPVVIKLLKEQMEVSFNQTQLKETIYKKNYKIDEISRRRVFLSRGNRPYLRPELTNKQNQWENWLKMAEINYRPPYQLRHTYASQMLSADAKTPFLAKQMGHKNWGLLHTIYASWIPDDNPYVMDDIAKNLGQKYETI